MPHKIAVCVFGCVTKEKYRREILKIQETWAKRMTYEPSVLQHPYQPLPGFACPGLRLMREGRAMTLTFFLGEERVAGFDGPEFVYLPGVGDDYESASDKQNLGLNYLSQHGNYDFVYVCGTDTFLNVDALERFLVWFDPEEPLYIGGHDNGREMVDAHGEVRRISFFLGGAGFVLSRAALRLLSPHLPDMTSRWRAYCDQHGYLDLRGACDVCMGYYADLLGIKYIRYYERFYECNYFGNIDISKHFDHCRWYDCCRQTIRPERIISCHNMSAEDMDRYNERLNRDGW